jgi:hypothetical protein
VSDANSDRQRLFFGPQRLDDCHQPTAFIVHWSVTPHPKPRCRFEYSNRFRRALFNSAREGEFTLGDWRILTVEDICAGSTQFLNEDVEEFALRSRWSRSRGMANDMKRSKLSIPCESRRALLASREGQADRSSRRIRTIRFGSSFSVLSLPRSHDTIFTRTRGSRSACQDASKRQAHICHR